MWKVITANPNPLFLPGALSLCGFMQTESFITLRRNFRRQHGGEPHTSETIRNWLSSFNETGCVYKVNPPESEVDRERLKLLLNRSVFPVF